jgi:hypothetical protein
VWDETADYDLTGQLVWPGAELLSEYLSKNQGRVKGSSVLELGAGLGEFLANAQPLFVFPGMFLFFCAVTQFQQTFWLLIG